MAIPHIPQDNLSIAAYDYVKQHLHPSILAHSLRVFFHAQKLSIRPYTYETFGQQVQWESDPLLFVACMFHDFGASSCCDNSPWRFEIEGADAAVAFLKSHGIEDTHAVWTAIACHTSAHIGERISPLARLLRYGPLSDFHRLSTGSIQVIDDPSESDGKRTYILRQDVEQIEAMYPRSDIEKVLAGNVIAQARTIPSKAPEATWPGTILASADANPEWSGINKAF